MLDSIIQLDHQLFFFINHELSNSFFDWIMPLLRNRYFWLPVYLFIVVFSLKQYGKKGLYLLIALGLTVGAADSISSKLLKPAFKRIRPCNNVELAQQTVQRIPCGSAFSFPSTHASDHFSLSVFLILLFYRQRKWIAPLAIFWATLVCFAQVYVGLHFPVDVFAGAIIGSIIGFAGASIYRYFQPSL